MVMVEGELPAPEELMMNSDPNCVTAATNTMSSTYVGSDGHLGNVFVYVKEGLGDMTFPAPSDVVTLNQEGCRYIPHVMGIQVGQTLNIVNSDPTLHNIHATPAVNEEFNMGQPMQGMEFPRTFDQPEVMVPMRCDVHGWMNSYIGVVDHPFFAVTGEDGMFDISALPPGDYVLEAWHEALGTQTQNVTVATGEHRPGVVHVLRVLTAPGEGTGPSRSALPAGRRLTRRAAGFSARRGAGRPRAARPRRERTA